MPRYHFNIFDGVGDVDYDGTELAGSQEARLEAIRCTGEILRDNPKSIAQIADWRMEVTDNTGLVLFRLDFSVMAAAAVLAPR